jgi:DUF4097 and DUF4098 domain-containing protein YvlB
LCLALAIGAMKPYFASAAAGAPVTARTSNGKISLKGGKGRIAARSEFGALELAAVQATVTAHSGNGQIHFSGSLENGDHTFSSNFGDVVLTLPADSQFRIDARTEFGSVNCAFDLTRSESSTDSHLLGDVGKGPGVNITIKTDNGSVEVKRAK